MISLLTDFSVVQMVYTAGPQSIRKADLNCGSSGRFLEMSFITCVGYFFFWLHYVFTYLPIREIVSTSVPTEGSLWIWNCSAGEAAVFPSSLSCHVVGLEYLWPEMSWKMSQNCPLLWKKKKGTWSLSINARFLWILTLNAVKALRLLAKHTQNFIYHVRVFRQSPFFVLEGTLGVSLFKPFTRCILKWGTGRNDLL